MQMPIPTDWDGVSYCRWAICWPDSVLWQAILSGLIEQPSQGRFWDANTGSITATQQAFLPTYISNFDLKEVIMACGDSGLSDIAAAITLLAQSQSSCAPCAPNGGVQGQVPFAGSEPVAWPGTEAPAILPEAGYPVGYDSLEAYLADKCSVANLLVDGLITSLTTLAAFDLANLIGLSSLLAAGVGFGLVVIPEIAIPVIVGALAVLATVGGVLLSIRDEIQSDRDTWVCAIYNGENAQQAIDIIAALIEALIATLSVSTAVGLAIKILLVAILNPDSVNKAFSFAGGVAYPDADCSECFEDVCQWVFESGTGVITRDGESFVLTATQTGGVGNYSIDIILTNSCCPTNDTITLESWTGTPSNGFGVWEWDDPCPTQLRIVTLSTPIADTWDGARISITDADPFTATLNIVAG